MKKLIICLLFTSICLSSYAQTIVPDSTFGTNGKFSYPTSSPNSTTISSGVFKTLMDNSGNLYFSVVPGSGPNTLVVKLDANGNTVAGFANNGIFTTGSFRSTGINLMDTTLFITGYNGPGFSGSPNPVFGQKISANKGISPQQFQSNIPGAGIFASALDKNANVLYFGGNDFASGGNNFIIFRKDLNAPFTETTTSLGYKTFKNTTSGVRYLTHLEVLNDGSVIASGHNGINSVVFKLDNNFNLSTSFGVNGFSTIQVQNATNNISYNFTIKDQFIYVTGSFKKTASQDDLFVAKLDLNGQTVAGFGTNGIATYGSTDSEGHNWDNISFQPNGKILMSGTVYINSTSYSLVVRLNSDGTPDNTFNDGTSIIKGSEPSTFNSIKALSDTSFIASGYNPGLPTFTLYIQKFKTRKAAILGTDDQTASESRSIKLYYSEKQVHILSQSPAEEVMVTSLTGTVKTYSNVKSFPVEENQVYVVKLRNGNQLFTQKIATY